MKKKKSFLKKTAGVCNLALTVIAVVFVATQIIMVIGDELKEMQKAQLAEKTAAQ